MKLLLRILILSLLCQLVAAGGVEFVYEVFSMPMKEAATLRRERLGGEESYRRILESLETDEVKQESWISLKVLDGEVATSEEIEEYIFPVEYEPLMLPSMVGADFLNFPQPPLFPIPDTATAYETKNLGETLEVEVKKLGENFDLIIRATRVALIGLDEFGERTGRVEMPRFSVQSLKTGVKLAPNQVALMGAISPPREMQKGNAKRVWLAFVTLVETKE